MRKYWWIILIAGVALYLIGGAAHQSGLRSTRSININGAITGTTTFINNVGQLLGAIGVAWGAAAGLWRLIFGKGDDMGSGNGATDPKGESRPPHRMDRWEREGYFDDKRDGEYTNSRGLAWRVRDGKIVDRGWVVDHDTSDPDNPEIEWDR